MWKRGNVADFQIPTFPNFQISNIAPSLRAVDDDRRARDPAGAGRGEKGDDRADFLRAPEAPERQLALDHVGDAGGIRLLALVPGPAGKHDRPGGDAVHADVRGRKLLRE